MSLPFGLFNETEKRLFTLRHQIEKLKTLNQIQESKLLLEKQDAYVVADEDDNIHCKESKLSDIEENEVNEKSLVPTLENSQTHFNNELPKERSKSNDNIHSAEIKTPRKYLKKGEGLSRYGIKFLNFKLGKNDVKHLKKPKQDDNLIMKCQNTNSKSEKSPSTQKDEEKKGSRVTRPEEQALNLSVCSTSSVISNLMENSIKSTPIKNNENSNTENKELKIIDKQNFQHSNNTEQDIKNAENLRRILNNNECIDTKSLNIIHDQLLTYYNDMYHFSNGDCNDLNEEEEQNCMDEEFSDGSECDSKCCCRKKSHYASTSISVFTEETTAVYSPIKNAMIDESVHKLTNNAVSVHYSSCPYESETSSKNDENELESLLHSRLKDLELEIDAFRNENSYLTELRSKYETEYSTFCEEKEHFVTEIRTEHVKKFKELEEEKKKLQKEKLSFEKYIKEIKNEHNKTEKKEIMILKEEIKTLKGEINKREGRWATAQAKIRTEMKQLKDQNSVLQEGVEKLQKPPKKVNFAPVMRKSKPSSSNTVSEKKELKTMTNEIELKSIQRSKNSNKVDTIYSSRINDHFQDLKIVEKNLQNTDKNSYELVSSNEDGKKEIWYTNGNVKKISADGKIIKTIYYNGDIKEFLTENEVIKYYYAKTKVWHSEYKNGLEIMEFPNGQTEKRFNDGRIEIFYQNGTIYSKHLFEEKWTYADGTVIVIDGNKNEKSIKFPNGQVETHTSEYKKRAYPDNTVKIVYNDGTQETRYANGRVRVKTKDGHLLSDSQITV